MSSKFRSPMAPGVVAGFGLAGSALVDALIIAIFTPYWIAIARLAPEETTQAQLQAFLYNLWLAIRLRGILYLCIVPFFIWWLYRSHCNLRSFGYEYVSRSSSWAIWGFFVPFLNLIRPYDMTEETWKYSDPAIEVVDGLPEGDFPSPALVRAWWLLFLTSRLGIYLALKWMAAIVSVEMLNLAMLLELVASLLDAGAAVCAVLLIWKLTTMQLGRVAKQAHTHSRDVMATM